MRIGEVAKKTALSKRRIRHYEDIGLIAPKRGKGKYREYSETDVKRLIGIKLLRDLGFGLTESRILLHVDSHPSALRGYLAKLLESEHATTANQIGRVKLLNDLLRSMSTSSGDLVDRIVALTARNHHSSTSSDLRRGKPVVHGQIKVVEDFARFARFGMEDEFLVERVEYTQFGSVFDSTDIRSSSVICKQMYARFALVTEASREFSESFHSLVWRQFAHAWGRVSSKIDFKGEGIFEELSEIRDAFASADFAVVLHVADLGGRRFRLVLPGQPLVVHLCRKSGIEYDATNFQA